MELTLKATGLDKLSIVKILQQTIEDIQHDVTGSTTIAGPAHTSTWILRDCPKEEPATPAITSQEDETASGDLVNLIIGTKEEENEDELTVSLSTHGQHLALNFETKQEAKACYDALLPVQEITLD